jgi:hypothetical protein
MESNKPNKLSEAGKKLWKRLVKQPEKPISRFPAPSWQKRTAEKFKEEETHGIKRGFRNLKTKKGKKDE